MKRTLLVIVLSLPLFACEPLGIPDPEKEAAAAAAEGRAIGGACRHAGRALEDCFVLNPSAQKSAIFEGWRAMNDYMSENKISEIKPTLPPPNAPKSVPAATGAGGEPAAPAEQEGKDAADEPSRPRSRTLRSMQDH